MFKLLMRTEVRKMLLSAASASDLRTEVFRITADGGLEQRWLDAVDPASEWTVWTRAPFEGRAVAVAAISGWEDQIETFVLDDHGQVWNRWWRYRVGWMPADGFNPLGAPYPNTRIEGLTALSAGGGHFNVFVGSADGKTAVLPHVVGPDGAYWQRCSEEGALGDGWWPAFGPASSGVYRRAPR